MTLANLIIDLAVKQKDLKRQTRQIILFRFALLAVLVYLSIYTFNHFNAWLGLFLIGLSISYFINIIITIKNMKKYLFVFALCLCAMFQTACQRVAPNYAGVLMENFGKNGKSDFSVVVGRVNTMAPGTELFQVPLFDQRGQFDKPSHLKAADNTEFSVQPMYTYRVIKDRAIDVVFDNKHIGSGDNFMSSIEDNILEPRMRDLIKEESRRYKTEELMADGGSLKFEKSIETIIEKEFEKRGLKLISFSCQLDFSETVKKKIDNRNEVNTNLSVLDQQIEEQKKRNELEELKTQQAIIKSRGLTPEILADEFIGKWDGKTPLYGNIPQIIKMQK